MHLIVEAMRRAFAARNAKLGDPDFVKNPVDELMSRRVGAAAARAPSASTRRRRRRISSPASASAHDGPHTTNFSVVDAEGNAVALTTTLNSWFGSGVTVPGLGFVLNDEMDDFATVPGTANGFGLMQGEPNAVAPGKRMLSSMSPTIVLGTEGQRGARPRRRRRLAHHHRRLRGAVEPRRLRHDAADAVRAPRFHQQDSPDTLFLEPHGLPDDVVRALRAMGHATKEVGHLADAPGNREARTELWEGAAEPRRAKRPEGPVAGWGACGPASG